MAKPRVFLSSTYYDLKSIRGEIERFVREKGYDPVLNERGNVAYTKEVSPEISCYREIETCDILISIIGGHFGSTSHDGNNSISQVELRTALDQYKQVYVFVERDVYAEYRTYLKNKNSEIEWASVDNVKIFQFLEDIFSLPNNNAIMPFETAHDIIGLLREQWAGLFQRLLQSQSSAGALATAQELRQGVEAARKLVELLRSDEKGSASSDEKMEAVLLPNHAAFSRLKKVLKVPYRVYFTTLDELNSWLTVRNYKEVKEGSWDHEGTREWYNSKDISNWTCSRFQKIFLAWMVALSQIRWNGKILLFEEKSGRESPIPATTTTIFHFDARSIYSKCTGYLLGWNCAGNDRDRKCSIIGREARMRSLLVAETRNLI